MKAWLCSIVLVLSAPFLSANDSGDYQGGVTIEVGWALDQQYVQVTSPDGQSSWAPSTPSPSGDDWDVLSTGELHAGSTTVKFSNGTPKKKNADGTWSRLGRVKKSKKLGELEGDETQDIRAQLPPHAYGGPGEDITTLPGGGRPPLIL